MYNYLISIDNSPKAFIKTCRMIESHFDKLKKEKLLVDVDGSTIQIYTLGKQSINIYDDYDYCSVYIKSDINLDEFLADKRTDFSF